MQLHYVVFYDTDTQKWGVEFDSEAYFPDGHIYDNTSATETGYGWCGIGDDTPITAALDESLVRLLGYIVDTWPAPGVVQEEEVRGEEHVDWCRDLYCYGCKEIV
jgi:hypothetical protein